MTFQAWREQALEEERRALNKAIKAMTQIGILWKDTPLSKEDLSLGDLMTIEEFRGMVESGALINSDGCGDYLQKKPDGSFHKEIKDWGVWCNLEHVDKATECGATHVLWYNK